MVPRQLSPQCRDFCVPLVPLEELPHPEKVPPREAALPRIFGGDCCLVVLQNVLRNLCHRRNLWITAPSRFPIRFPEICAICVICG